MTTDLTTTTRPAGLEFTDEQRQMIRDTFANGASNAEFAVLMEIARTRNLNPMLRQVYFVKRWDKGKAREVWATQVSIDGLRAIAERTGLYAGQDEPEFVDDEKTGKPKLCKVKVYRKDWQRPAVGVVYFAEAVQTTKDGTPTQFWQKMPHTMLAKVAEAFAIRKAFPEDTGGLYTNEEMPDEEPRARSADARVQHHEPPPQGSRVALPPGIEADTGPAADRNAAAKVDADRARRAAADATPEDAPDPVVREEATAVELALAAVDACRSTRLLSAAAKVLCAKHHPGDESIARGTDPLSHAEWTVIADAVHARRDALKAQTGPSDHQAA